MGILREIGFAPGVVKDDTELAAALRRNIRRWTDSDRIRFVNGLPQKIGGWKHHVSTTFNGLCRGLMAWQDNDSVARLAIGTHKKLYAAESSTFNNITPIRKTSSLTNPFDTTSGSLTVTVNDTAHGAVVGDFIQVSSATAVGGITIDGNYDIQTVPNANSYTIKHTSAATSTASGGGSPSVQYEIQIGRADAAQGDGYGVGTYSDGTYGTVRKTYVVLAPRTWTLDQWGAYLVACPRGGSIYEWQLNTANRAAVLTNAPTTNTGIFVTEEKHLVVLGAGGAKMTVQWCDQDANTSWTASDQTTAGSRAVTGGTEILFGLRVAGTNLIFTDAAVWKMTFIGGLDIFGFEQIAAGAAGIIAPRAAAEVGGVAYWMSFNDFLMFDGRVRAIPNSKDIRRFVFDALTSLQRDKCFCGVNTKFSEVWWLYPTGNEINRYVKVNLDDFSWDVGALARTAMIDRGIFVNPLAASTDSLIYAHESGNDDVAGTASTTSVMAEYIMSSPLVLERGARSFDIMAVVPDFKDLSGSLTITLLTRTYPQDTETTTIAGTVGTSTTKIDTRVSGRQAKVRFGDSTAGGFWRLGTITFDVVPGGER